jgi:hypothetical protein
MTRDRITHLVIAVLVVAVGFWVARNTYWENTHIPVPLKGEAATNPYYGVQHLTSALGVRSNFVASLSATVPNRGVLLIDGFQGDMNHTHLDNLAPWVEAGGRLIVTDDVLRGDPKLQEWADIHRSMRFDAEEKKKLAGLPHDAEDNCVPMNVAEYGNATDERLTYCKPPSEFAWNTKRKPAWSLSDDYGLQVLRVSMKRGSITVIPRLALISNRNLIKHDHAQIFVAAANIKSGDVLYIVNVAQAETLLAIIWRLAAPAVVFSALAIICLILRALPRFGPPVPSPAMARRSLAEQIRANAAFAWRTRKLTALRAAVRRALDETAQRRIAAYNSLDVRKRVNAIAECAGTDAKQLNSAMTEAAIASPQIQRAAISLLEQSRRLLNARTRKTQGRP